MRGKALILVEIVIGNPHVLIQVYPNKYQLIHRRTRHFLRRSFENGTYRSSGLEAF
ncbi:MAG: hypothetical protein H0X31_18090 [Nostocaceae cyanobacterium]|nr:hypothetical protein [Nostocaceae cyanobacterium]